MITIKNAALAAWVFAVKTSLAREALPAGKAETEPRRSAPAAPLTDRVATPAVINNIEAKLRVLASTSILGLRVSLETAPATWASTPAGADPKAALHATAAAGQVDDARQRGGGTAIIVHFAPPGGASMKTVFTPDEFEHYMREAGPQGEGSFVNADGKVHSMWEALNRAMGGPRIQRVRTEDQATRQPSVKSSEEVAPVPGIRLAQMIADLLAQSAEGAVAEPQPGEADAPKAGSTGGPFDVGTTQAAPPKRAATKPGTGSGGMFWIGTSGLPAASRTAGEEPTAGQLDLRA